MKRFLNEAKKKNTILISEALGVVPEFVVNSLNKIRAINYIPLIYGITPADTNNLYFPANHLQEAFVTFALHDSETLKGWWINKPDYDKQEILDYLFGQNQENSLDYPDVNNKLQFAILKEVYKSKALIKVLIWTDIFLSNSDDGINKPGCQMGQWISRMPIEADLDDLIRAAKNNQSSITSQNAVNLINNLKSSSL